MSDYREILAELSDPLDSDEFAINRRKFLALTAAGASTAAIAATLGPWANRVQALVGPPLGENEGVLVCIMLGGGNDGFNTLCPVDNGRYRDLRGGLALDPAEVHRIDGGMALHPSLTTVKSLYDQGRCAIVQGVGYPDENLSHFDSMAHWLRGNVGTSPDDGGRTGWIGRWMDGIDRSDFTGVNLGSSVPLHMQGQVSSAIGLPAGSAPKFGNRNTGEDQRLYATLRDIGTNSTGLGPLGDGVAAALSESIVLARDIGNLYNDGLPRGFARELAVAARLINSDIGVRVIGMSHGSFDTHGSQAFAHADRLAQLDAAIAAFYAELDPAYSGRVTLMTFSEFGRRPEVNGSGGTDHGTASVSFIMGDRVDGGLKGGYPSLTDLDRRDNFKYTVDFRSIYATMLDGWLGADADEVLGGGIERLPLLRGGPVGGDVAPSAGRVDVNAPHGYLLVRSNGAIHNFGNMPTLGSAITSDVVGAQVHPSGGGYWLASADGTIAAFGDADDHGSMLGTRLAGEIVDMEAYPTGRGYWMLGEDGGVFSFGDAPFFGSTGGVRLNRPVVGMTSHPQGKGYWFVARDGGVFTYGDIGFYGSTGNIRLNKPIVGMESTPSGRGYWLVATDGGIFAFGDAGFYGSTGGITLDRPIIGMKATPSGKGYWLCANDGGIFAFGDASFQGSLGGKGYRDVVAMLA